MSTHSADAGPVVSPSVGSLRRRRRLLSLLFAIALLTRLPALLHPQPIDDEATYSVVANEIVDGGLPYRDAIERKPPLLFYVYAGVFEVFGRSNWYALHGVATVWLLATMAGLAVIGSELGSPDAGLVGAAAYALFLPLVVWRNLAFNGEMLMNLPIVWAWVLAFGVGRSRGQVKLVASGALTMVGFFLKQPAAIAAVPLIGYFWLPEYRRRRHGTLRTSLADSLWFCAGGAMVLAAAIVLLWRAGILRDAFYWTIRDHDLPHIFWMRALVFSLAFAAASLPLLAWAWASVASRATWRERPAERRALVWFVVVSAIGTAAGGRFYPHYYIQMLPPLAILAGVGVDAVRTGRLERPGWLPPLRVSYAWAGGLAIAFALSNTYWLSLHRQPSESGRYIRAHATGDDRIFVWGQAPQVYLDASRRPASRFIATFPLTGYIFGGPLPGVDTRSRILPGAWDTLARDLAAHPPAFIVDREVGRDALYPLASFPMLASMVADRYEPRFTSASEVVYARRR